jgi:hypothetical protein
VHLIRSTILLSDSHIVELGHDVISHARVGVPVGNDILACGGGVGVLVVIVVGCIEALIAVQCCVAHFPTHLAHDFVTTAVSTTDPPQKATLTLICCCSL